MELMSGGKTEEVNGYFDGINRMDRMRVKTDTNKKYVFNN